ncbi:MAG: hypothetical protein PHU03_05820 [Syntrophales bacterium]|nr:hypothetical protein [Syntrophales bacterium]
MQVLIGGIVAAVVGFLGVIVWWKQFLILLAGGIPIALLLGGALAIYVGYDEVRDQMREKKEAKDQTEELEKTKQELEKAKAQTEELEKAKQELEKARAAAEKYKEELEKAKGGSNSKKS